MSRLASMSAATSGQQLVDAAVTALFVPGDRPERFNKAAESGAGVVIIDLEDAVAADSKAMALAAVVDALSSGDVRAVVRVNTRGSQSHVAEIAALLALSKVVGHGLLGIMLPKADDPDYLMQLRDRFPKELALIPLIESAAGVVHALELAQLPGVTRLAFGAIDFALDINASGEDRFLDHARSELVLASRAAGISAPLDSPCTEIQDLEQIADSARLARNFGFGGKLCIHPGQIIPVKTAFMPTEDEVAWALSVISVIGSEGAATQVAGQMIDRPVTERAKRILNQAGKEQ